MAAGISSPGNYVWREKASLFIILGPLMLSMWIITSCGIKLIFGLDWMNSFLIGACVTPTDPVLANSIIQGSFADNHIPKNVRLLISAESAANDGLGLGFVLLPLYLSRFSSAGEGFGFFLLNVMMYQILMSMILGGGIGYVARKLLKLAQRRDWIDKESLLGFSVALALTVSGSMSLLGSDDILVTISNGRRVIQQAWLYPGIFGSTRL
jgi:sodium/hydrogen antiporter